MRSCPNCGQKLALFSRGRFCSSTCSDSFRREEARWWELSSVDRNTKNGSAWDPKEDAEDDAAQFIWAGILATANYIRKRQPFSPQPRRKVVKLKEGSNEVPLYFIGGGLTELRLSQMMKRGSRNICSRGSMAVSMASCRTQKRDGCLTRHGRASSGVHKGAFDSREIFALRPGRNFLLWPACI